MDEVKTNRVVRISNVELAREVRAVLKQKFPGVKFKVHSSGYGPVNVYEENHRVYEEDLREALEVFNAIYKDENASMEEIMNGDGGWRKVQYVRFEDDGSLTPYYYSNVYVTAMSRQLEISIFEQMMGGN